MTPSRNSAALYPPLWAAAAALLFLFPAVPSVFPGDPDESGERSFDLHRYLQGRHVFQRQCVPCHGPAGRGDGPWAEGLTDQPRNFRTGIFKFRTTPYGKLPTDADLRRTIRSGVSGTAMPAFIKLSDGDVEALTVFLQNLSRRWEDESLRADPLPLPPPPAWFTHRAETETRVEAGKILYDQICATCHGPQGHGDGEAGQELIDVWGNPIRPAALSRAHHKSGDSRSDLYRTIATGLDGTPMLGFADALSAEQIWSLVAWIKSIEGTAPKAP